MSDSIKSAIEAMKAEKARLLEQAAADLDAAMAADLAELERLAKKYNLRVVGDEDIARAAVASSSSAVAPPTDRGSMTLGELASVYRSDERSPLRAMRFHVRSTQEGYLDKIADAYGAVPLPDLNADVIRKWYNEWADGGKLSMGQILTGRLRSLFSFGTTVLNDAQCQRLSIIMNQMRFPKPLVRTEHLTSEMVEAIRAKARELGKPSIALAQAIQFELFLSQKDTIGEWVPATEPGESDVIVDGSKWLYGIRWSEIDSNLILRHETSFRTKKIELDLKRAPMVMWEIDQLDGGRRTSGPVVISEWGQKPWSNTEFRRWWRKIADAAGVPKTIRNMDSRPLEARSTTTKAKLSMLSTATFEQTEKPEGPVH